MCPNQPCASTGITVHSPSTIQASSSAQLWEVVADIVFNHQEGILNWIEEGRVRGEEKKVKPISTKKVKCCMDRISVMDGSIVKNQKA
jgi:hypothetical protein